ncbi:MAG TPA: metallophosphoesterase [Myxococcales bacterium]|nr:metallophosphoesterase [Myxococcales bacterium]HIN86989.1 metallophosphoesterase [Myxococcales bacterium]
MRIAQLSDLHIFDSEGVMARDFVSKRAIGGVNLLIGRHKNHPLELAERLIADVTSQSLDHVVVTGDVTNLSLPGEFQRAAGLLRLIGGYDALTVIPGNHDIYTRGAEKQRRFESYFGHTLFGSDMDSEDRDFPAIKDLGEVLVIGLCSAFASSLLTSWGRVGDEQLSRLESQLSSGKYDNHFKVALVHHNIHQRGFLAEKTALLKDRDEVVQRLLKLKVKLLLHGHTHKAHRFEVSRDDHTMQIMGSGSSTWNSREPEHCARYNIYTITDSLESVRTRIYDHERRRFEWLV